MGKRVILTGTAIVNFRKVIEDVSGYEIDEMREDPDMQECQIMEEDLIDIEMIHEIEMHVE